MTYLEMCLHMQFGAMAVAYLFVLGYQHNDTELMVGSFTLLGIYLGVHNA